MTNHADRSTRPDCDRQSGVTLVELLVVITIFAVVGGIAVAGLISAFRSGFETQTRIDARQELELTLQQVARVLRSAERLEIIDDAAAGVVPASAVGADITSATVSDRLFFGVGAVDGEPVLFQCRGSSSCLTDPDAPRRDLITVIGNDISDPAREVFVYLDRAGERMPPGDEASARLLRIRLERVLSGDRNPVVVETSVTIRSSRYLTEVDP